VKAKGLQVGDCVVAETALYHETSQQVVFKRVVDTGEVIVVSEIVRKSRGYQVSRLDFYDRFGRHWKLNGDDLKGVLCVPPLTATDEWRLVQRSLAHGTPIMAFYTSEECVCRRHKLDLFSKEKNFRVIRVKRVSP
jgi:hypothetical protein